jgi:hypothetical protein
MLMVPADLQRCDTVLRSRVEEGAVRARGAVCKITLVETPSKILGGRAYQQGLAQVLKRVAGQPMFLWCSYGTIIDKHRPHRLM